MGVMLFVAVVTILTFYFSQTIFFDRFEEVAQKLSYPSSHPFRQFLEHQKSTLNDLFLVASIANFLAIVAIGAFMSNKIAGPIYRICMTLKEIRDSGQTKMISIRKDDFFQELPDAINEVINAETVADEQQQAPKSEVS
jgi:hypothetical protein